MLQVREYSPRRIKTQHGAADESGQPASSPGSFSSPADIYSATPAVGQGPHASSTSNPNHPTSFAVPRNMSSSAEQINGLPAGQLTEAMQSGRPWWAKELGLTKEPSRNTHQRESSLTSTLGSTGPNSPCSPSILTPHIAVNDSIDDPFRDGQGNGSWNYHFASDPIPFHQDQYYCGGSHLYGMNMNDQSGKHAYTTNGFIGNRATEPPRGMDTPYSPGAQQSVPMTSSASAPMADVTQSHGHDPSGLRQTGGSGSASRRQGRAMPDVPKLDRTMTDIYDDGLYNPNLDIISSASPSAGAPSSPGDDIFSQRLDAAGSIGHAHQGHGGTVVGNAPAAQHHTNLRPHEAQLFQGTSDTHSPQTISPHDSMLDFEADGGSSNFPLFPRSEPTRFGTIDAMSEGNFSQMSFGGGADDNNLHYMPTATSSSLYASHDFPVFDARNDLRSSDHPTHSDTGGTTELIGPDPRSVENAGSGAGGTYSCTYHGCAQRFDTPTLLQKHKREGHRQANSLKTTPRGAKSGVMDTQAGPHRCYRINPGTGKICKAVFSRPYDLTRHEDTIHNARKQKVRCDLCTEEKLFSRADALTRHYRVCHPDVELPSKHKRRRPAGQT